MSKTTETIQMLTELAVKENTRRTRLQFAVEMTELRLTRHCATLESALAYFQLSGLSDSQMWYFRKAQEVLHLQETRGIPQDEALEIILALSYLPWG